MTGRTIIGFWKPTQKYGWMSQWYDSPFVIDGERFNCCEQYMMASKARLFGDEKVRDQIMKTSNPNNMKRLGRAVKGFDDSVWMSKCFGIVCDGNYAKFTQDEHLRDLLLGTSNAILAEASPFDKIWGIGMTVDDKRFNNPKLWRGKNYLGGALMKVRDKIRTDMKEDSEASGKACD